MRHLVTMVPLVFGLALAQLLRFDPLAAQGPGTPADSAAIMAALQNWERGWEIYDAELAARDYSHDADWTNAFGFRRIGRENVHSMLEEAFSIPAVTAGKTEYEFHDLRFLSPEIALLRSQAIREGQLLADGTTEPRRIAHLRVFAKQNGEWLIVSHLITDERTPGRPR